MAAWSRSRLNCSSSGFAHSKNPSSSAPAGRQAPSRSSAVTRRGNQGIAQMEFLAARWTETCSSPRCRAEAEQMVRRSPTSCSTCHEGVGNRQIRAGSDQVRRGRLTCNCGEPACLLSTREISLPQYPDSSPHLIPAIPYSVAIAFCWIG